MTPERNRILEREVLRLQQHRDSHSWRRRRDGQVPGAPEGVVVDVPPQEPDNDEHGSER
jgi:hypothetical protein